MSKKKPQDAIPLDRLLLDDGFRRNLKIERKSADRDERLIDAVDEALHGNAAANIRRKDTNRETAKQAKIKQGLKTKATIKAIMAKHPPDAKPRDIWPDVRDAIGEMSSITERHFRKVLREIK